MEMFDLTIIWAGIIGFGLMMYVLMDGFDLGLGILYPFAPDEDARDVMMNSVAPVWDGNETWLVLAGAGLLGAFPLVYSVFLPALYIGVFLMLAGLVFRGVAFEFRFKSRRNRRWWNRAFCWGSGVAAFAQGAVVGAYIQGFHVENFAFAGGAFDWLTPFSVLTGFGLMAGYALLGATWLILKSEGHIQEWAYKITRCCWRWYWASSVSSASDSVRESGGLGALVRSFATDLGVPGIGAAVGFHGVSLRETS